METNNTIDKTIFYEYFNTLYICFDKDMKSVPKSAEESMLKSIESNLGLIANRYSNWFDTEIYAMNVGNVKPKWSELTYDFIGVKIHIKNKANNQSTNDVEEKIDAFLRDFGFIRHLNEIGSIDATPTKDIDEKYIKTHSNMLWLYALESSAITYGLLLFSAPLFLYGGLGSGILLPTWSALDRKFKDWKKNNTAIVNLNKEYNHTVENEDIMKLFKNAYPNLQSGHDYTMKDIFSIAKEGIMEKIKSSITK